MKYVFNDGGRNLYFKCKDVGDCVTRAIAITLNKDYKEVYDMIRKVTGETPRNGVNTKTPRFKKFMSDLGYCWTPCMGIGTGCTTHLSEDEIPSGRIICSVSGHWVAIIDGVINDTKNCSRGGTRCVYGYWKYCG